ncbi:MAG: hypothetical protein M5U27_10210 [Gaiella sp.]|nr:hypothetical protein [Gaiella sp.]
MDAIIEELGGEEDTHRTALILADLVRTGYLEETASTDQLPGPLWCRLAEKGLQVTAGWPSSSGQLAYERLIALLDQRIAEATDDDERSRWERVRDGVLGIGRDVFVGVITGVATAQAKNLGS